MRHFSKCLSSDRRGNVAVTFALVLVPLLAFAGAAIDCTRAFSIRSVIQHAADSAVLATAMAPGGTLAAATGAGNKAFTANYAKTATFQPDKPAGESGVIVVTAGASVPTSVMNVVGITKIDVGVTAKAKAFSDAGAIEVALVLDNTGSMIATRMSAPGTDPVGRGLRQGQA